MKTASRLVSACFAILATVSIAACGGPSADADEAAPATIASAMPSLAAVADLGVRNAAMPTPGLVTAGQPTEEQFDALAAMGYENFISLRPTSEDGAGWEEAHVSGSDVSFNRIPVQGGSGLTRENVDRLAELLDEAGSEGAVLYCASSNRVGSLLALKAYWHDGAAPEEALEIGRAAGMRSLEGRVTELLAEPR